MCFSNLQFVVHFDTESPEYETDSMYKDKTTMCFMNKTHDNVQEIIDHKYNMRLSNPVLSFNIVKHDQKLIWN